MYKHTFTLPILFLSFIISMNTHAMEREYEVAARQAEEYNKTHPFMQFPLETQQNIISIGYTHDDYLKMTGKKFDGLKTVVQVFFGLNRVCRHFNQHIADKKLILPWLDLSDDCKIKMMKKTGSHVVNFSRQEKDLAVPLSFVYCGADPNAKVYFNLPFLSSILSFVKSESIIKMLLDHRADPCVITSTSGGYPACFSALTPAIAKLLVEEIDKNEFLKKFGSMTSFLIGPQCSLEMMEFWIGYGLNPKSLNNNLASLFHYLVGVIKWGGGGSFGNLETILTKIEFLLKYMPDMMNHKNKNGQTPLDILETCRDDFKFVRDFKQLFRDHGAKTTQELEDFARQAEEYNKTQPFMQLPLDMQQNIIFAGYANEINSKVDDKKFAALMDLVRTFFTLNRVCKYFNQSIADKKIKLPWSDLHNGDQDKMIKKIIDYLTDHKEQKEKGFIVPLAFVYTGVDPHLKVCLGSMPLFSYMLEFVKNESAIKMLLQHGADPCVMSMNLSREPACFKALTPAIGKVLVEKINKDAFLEKYGSMTTYLLWPRYSVDMMQFWVGYGLNPKCLDDPLFHLLVLSSKNGGRNGDKLENILAKTEFLLTCAPDMINHRNKANDTPLDAAIALTGRYGECELSWTEEVIKLLRKHGAKTRRELEKELMAELLLQQKNMKI